MAEKKAQRQSSIDHEQIKHFSKDSAHWWNPNGPFKPLHKINPMRLHFIKEQVCDHYGRDYEQTSALNGLDILDVGCGGGLVCEPLARMSANITGLDADEQAISVAKEHAKTSKLDIAYLSQDLHHLEQKFDVVLALEIVEHVRDIPLFIGQCAKRLKPGGLLIMSTFNRTPKSYALGIVAAEHILRWVPKGTHHWHKFIKPSEIAAHARTHNLQPTQISGLIYNPFKDEFSLSDTDFDVNYMISLSAKS